ncbi:cupin domain-containing protein [Acinetobacter sp. AOR15_HL]|uniref:JmjC domain-containing protein n=1 Tax=unclassified Acinetobacter TaxID=196816 RepID=UPI0022EB7A12|nr:MULTISPECIES: cupin domain-containing protein [unclassified Acinetobacter]MDA3556169.1 cupin domain-containing protein [Acinetobacter sp. AOR15_HL]MDA3571626.1 cupin domain-containing protein [Acinetobacter sp. AOR14_HL]
MLINLNMPYSHFRENYQEKQPFVFKQAVKKNNVTWSDINEIINRCDASSNDFRVSFADGNVPKERYIQTYYNIGVLHKKIIKSKFYDFLKKGATIVANNIFDEPKFNDFAKEIAQYTGRQTITSAYIAFGNKDSYRAHWDSRDVFAVQLMGRKRWIIYKPSLELPLYMQQSKDFEQDYPCPEEIFMDVTLEEGDILYIPRGWWHNPSPLGEPTVHLAIGTFPAFAIDFVTWIFKNLPENYSARVALENYEFDKEELEKLSEHIRDSIINEEKYKQFMEEFFTNQRLESRLNIETLGNENTNWIPKNKLIRFNTFRVDFHDEYLITSDGKISFKNELLKLKDFIINHKILPIQKILDEFKLMDKSKIEETLYYLAQQNFIEIVDNK